MVDSLNKAAQSNKEGKFRQALQEYRDIIELDPQNALAYGGVGYALLRLGEYDKAAEAHRRALDLDPTLSISHADLGYIYQVKQLYHESEKELKQAIELDPMLAIANVNLGFVLIAQARFEEGESALRRALELNPQNSSAHRNVASIYLHSHRYDDAIRVARRSFDLSPSIRSGWFLSLVVAAKYMWVLLPVGLALAAYVLYQNIFPKLLVLIVFAVLMIWNIVQNAKRKRYREALTVSALTACVLVFYIYS